MRVRVSKSCGCAIRLASRASIARRSPHLGEGEAPLPACNTIPLCEEALEKAVENAFSLFCPNIHCVEQVKSASLTFR